MQEALLCSLAFLLVGSLDYFTSLQCVIRPIVLGPIVGLFCGDFKTGIIMGAELEAIYMGVSSIGGVVPSNFRVATCVGVGLVICTGIDFESGIAIAVTVGTLVNYFGTMEKAVRSVLHPFMIKALEKGQYKKYISEMWLQSVFVNNGVYALIIFLCLLLGSEAVQLFVDNVPQFVMTGLSAAGGMLVVIGLALITQAVWMKNGIIYILIGFILIKFMGLSTLAIAVVGTILAVLTFSNDMEMKKIKEAALASHAVSEGDDFYG